jgi:splicing factor 3A subunit 1
MVVSLPLPPGLTFPPQDLKNIIDKTVEFVNKGGAAFEATIIQKGKDNPTFGFIKPGHPFHPYYKYKLAEIKAAGPGSAVQPGDEAPKSISALPTAPSKVAAPPSKQIKPTAAEPPPPLEFYLNLPDISAQELDIMRLTAQFVARNGQQFHHGLLNRENRNPQFDFLKHNHPLNIIFSALVNCYSKVLLPPRDTLEKLRSAAYRDKSVMLEKAVSHMEWEQTQERARKKAEEEEDQERTAMALIDWHDFVVVETIEFFDDEPDLPAPASYDQLMAGVIPAAPEPEVKDVEEEMETDEMEMEEEKPEPVVEPPPPPPAAAAPESPPKSPEPELPPLPPPDTKLKILKEPIKRPEPKRHTAMMLCPRCNTMVPQEEYSEHMRIELLDPKFSEERKRQELRKKEAAQPISDISKNLASLAKRRTDIFGSVETEIGKAIGEEEEEAGPEKVTWDGHSGSIGRTTTAVNEQITAIHASKGLSSGDEKPAIGPQGVHPITSTQSQPVRQPIITVVGGTPSMPRPVIAPAVPATPHQPLISMPPGMMPGMPYGMHGMMPGMMPGMPGMIPGMYAYGAPGLPHQPPPPDDEPGAKRQKLEELNLIPEEKFLADYPMPVNLVVQVPPPPADKNEWNFQGQILEFILPPTGTIANVKDKIKEALGMPPNKQKLKGPLISILKDTQTLAYYNVTPGTVLVLGIKERGGRKK